MKWIVIGLLVAGTFGVIWTAPWKDDVERLTDDVQQRFSQARATLAVLDGAASGDCSRVGRPAPSDVRDAVEMIAAQAKRNPDAKTLAPSGQSATTVREVATRQAEQIDRCIQTLPRVGAGWADLRNTLESAAKQT